MKSVVEILRKFVVLYLILIASFIALLVFSASLRPTARFQKNMIGSAAHLAIAGDYTRPNRTWLDNCSDSVLMNVAYSFEPDTPLASGMKAKYYVTGKIPNASADFKQLVDGNCREMKSYSYGRYWFGQSALLRLASFLLPLQKIYSMIEMFVLALAMVTFVFVWNKVGKYPAFVLLAILALSNLYIFSLSLQYWPPLFLGLGGILFMLFFDKPNWRVLVFFTIGMLCAYLDLLTAPILSFGLPALLIGCLEMKQLEEKNSCLRDYVPILFGYPLAWGLGYLLSWGTKILLMSLCYGDFSALTQFRERISMIGHGQNITRLDALQMNILSLYDSSNVIFICFGTVVFGFFIYALYSVWKKRAVFNWRSALVYFSFACIPVMIILAVPNHTYVHSYMTYRGLAVSSGALFMIFTSFQYALRLNERFVPDCNRIIRELVKLFQPLKNLYRHFVPWQDS